MGKVRVSRRTAAEAVVKLAILLLLFDFCKSSSVFSVVGTMNGNVTLSPSNIQPAKEILWKKGKNKVIEWDSDGLTAYPLFRDRVALDPSGALHISNLTSSDEGDYEIEIHPSSKVMKFNLIVFDPLPFPTLECNPVNESIVVQCAVPENYSRHREQLTYSWHCPFPQCGESTTPVLHLTKNGDLQKHKGQLECVVANPESNRTSSVDLSICIPHDPSRSRYPLLIMPVIIVVWLSVMCYWKRNRRAGPTT